MQISSAMTAKQFFRMYKILVFSLITSLRRLKKGCRLQKNKIEYTNFEGR